MLFRKNHIFSALTVMILAVTFLYSCSPVDLEFTSAPSPGRTEENETVRIPDDYRNVFIMYAMGFNNLRGYLAEDIRDILSSPMMSSGRDIIIILSHIADRSEGKIYDPSIPVSPTFTKISRNFDGSIQKDTLTIATESFTIDENTLLASTETLQKSLEYIKENFHATYRLYFNRRFDFGDRFCIILHKKTEEKRHSLHRMSSRGKLSVQGKLRL